MSPGHLVQSQDHAQHFRRRCSVIHIQGYVALTRCCFQDKRQGQQFNGREDDDENDQVEPRLSSADSDQD